MQSQMDFPIVISGTTVETRRGEDMSDKIFHCREVPVEGTTYSKLVTSDDLVAVVVARRRIGDGWSSRVFYPILKKQMSIDSRIVRYVSSEEFKDKYMEASLDTFDMEKFDKLVETVFPKVDHESVRYHFQGFTRLSVEFIPDDSKFLVESEHGVERISFYKPECMYMST